jgi:hypothetical protein
MTGARRLFTIVMLLAFLESLVLSAGLETRPWVDIPTARAAEPAATESAGRQSELTVTYTRHEWWVVRWSDNQPVCQVYIDHEGLPTSDDILYDCGGTVYKLWEGTPACNSYSEDSGGTDACTGVYLFYIGNAPAEKKILIDLPPLRVNFSLVGCTPIKPENLCYEVPSLRFVGVEPLPFYEVSAIHVTVDGRTTTCDIGSDSGATPYCEIHLFATPEAGVLMEFWADSTYGDSSEHFTALVRVIDTGVSSSPTGRGWYVDVISSQWQGGDPLASCVETWQAFPPVGGPPGWLLTPEHPALLATAEPYAYLAGRLIAQGLVNAAGCPGGGLLSNGYADACGVEAAMPQVIEWQNRFDEQILAVALETGVPAQLLKNLFAQESQFWPGAYKDPLEFGLGQITDNGAETILLWNQEFYAQFCPTVLDASVCARGYVYLDSDSQALLRGALAAQARSDCPECLEGVDIANVNATINLFAHTLLANCVQVARMVYNATGRAAGQVSSYEDLWRYTVANYHVGPGCVSYALYTSWAAGAKMEWSRVSTYLTDACEGVIPYVEKLTSTP